MNNAPTLPTSCGSLPPEGALRLRPGEAGSAAPAREKKAYAPKLGGKNFGVLLPWWDMLFGTANFELRYDATGVRDQVEQRRNYGSGFWSQQWLGMKRLFGRA